MEFPTLIGTSRNKNVNFFSAPSKEAIFFSTRSSGLIQKQETKPQETTTPELPDSTTSTTFLKKFWQAQREEAHLTTKN